MYAIPIYWVEPSLDLNIINATNRLLDSIMTSTNYPINSLISISSDIIYKKNIHQIMMFIGKIIKYSNNKTYSKSSIDFYSKKLAEKTEKLVKYLNMTYIGTKPKLCIPTYNFKLNPKSVANFRMEKVDFDPMNPLDYNQSQCIKHIDSVPNAINIINVYQLSIHFCYDSLQTIQSEYKMSQLELAIHNKYKLDSEIDSDIITIYLSIHNDTNAPIDINDLFHKFFDSIGASYNMLYTWYI